MSDDKTSPQPNVVIRVFGAGWSSGWLFTVGFAHMGIMKAILAFAIWPYLLGAALSP